MKKNHVYIIAIVLVAITGGWFAYKYFLKKDVVAVASGEKKAVQTFAPNSCWLYHEFVYRVDFSDDSLESFLFIRNADGSFSPSAADSAANHITGNGFIIDSTGACVITEKMANPWLLSDEEQIPLKELIDAWLESKTGLINKDYRISGQTVVLFAALNNPKDFIEYAISSPVPGQQGYSLVYPVKKTMLTGIRNDIAFSALTAGSDTAVLQILKSTFNENNPQNALIKTAIDSISVTRSADGFLENIKVLAGDEFFYEGSAAFDQNGRLLGNLRYENKKWALVPISSFVQNPPTYAENEIQEKWEYDNAGLAWKKIYSINNVGTTTDATYNPGPLEPTIKVYPSPTPK